MKRVYIAGAIQGNENKQNYRKILNKREVERCHFTFKERPWHSAKLDSKRPSCRILENNCKISYERVRGTLLKMHGVFSVKLGKNLTLSVFGFCGSAILWKESATRH